MRSGVAVTLAGVSGGYKTGPPRCLFPQDQKDRHVLVDLPPASPLLSYRFHCTQDYIFQKTAAQSAPAFTRMEEGQPTLVR